MATNINTFAGLLSIQCPSNHCPRCSKCRQNWLHQQHLFHICVCEGSGDSHDSTEKHSHISRTTAFLKFALLNCRHTDNSIVISSRYTGGDKIPAPFLHWPTSSLRLQNLIRPMWHWGERISEISSQESWGKLTQKKMPNKDCSA